MATTAETIRNEYPLPVYNYRVEIGSEAIAFSEVSGLDIAYDVGSYKESQVTAQPGPRQLIFPAQSASIIVTLKKGIIKGVSIKVMYAWISTVITNQVDKRDIFVRLCNEKGEPVISWKVGNAFPTKLSAPTFDANSNDAAIETMELQADYITMEEN
jgi:phage tail-like protein